MTTHMTPRHSSVFCWCDRQRWWICGVPAAAVSTAAAVIITSEHDDKNDSNDDRDHNSQNEHHLQILPPVLFLQFAGRRLKLRRASL